MKIYAKQIEPEHQISPMQFDRNIPDNIAVYGNKDYKEHYPKIFKEVLNTLESKELLTIVEIMRSLTEEIDDISRYIEGLDIQKINDGIKKVIIEYFPPMKGEYSEEDIFSLAESIWDYSYYNSNKYVCDILSVMTGTEWKQKRISGVVQAQWNEICYPASEWSSEDLRVFEAKYFNTGSEWIIHDEDSIPETPCDIKGYAIYCASTLEEEVRQEIADNCEVDPTDVVLYAYDGYVQTPKYREIV